MLSRFHLIPERYGRTDRRTDGQIFYINIAHQYADPPPAIKSSNTNVLTVQLFTVYSQCPPTTSMQAHREGLAHHCLMASLITLWPRWSHSSTVCCCTSSTSLSCKVASVLRISFFRPPSVHPLFEQQPEKNCLDWDRITGDIETRT